MKTSTQILPGIKFIGWIECRHLLRRIDLNAICGGVVPVLTDIHPIPFFDDPSCECKTSKDSRGRQDAATLKFSTDELIPSGHIAFIVTDAGDNSYIIGTREEPFPVIEYERKTGSPSGDPAGYEYEIKHTGIKSLVPCVI